MTTEISPAHPLASCYRTRRDDSEPFGHHWCGPDTFPHWDEILVARYEADSDGRTVEVYCMACPARFHTIRVLPGENGVGEPMLGYELGTGSGSARSAADVAFAISGGMLSLHDFGAVPVDTARRVARMIR